MGIGNYLMKNKLKGIEKMMYNPAEGGVGAPTSGRDNPIVPERGAPTYQFLSHKPINITNKK